MEGNSLQVDRRVVELLKQGDAETFEKVFFSFAERIYYFAMRYMRNQHDAEEIVQEVKQARARDVQIGQQTREGGRFCRIRHVLQNVECAIG